MDTGSANCGAHCGRYCLHSDHSSVSWTKACSFVPVQTHNVFTQHTYVQCVPTLPNSTHDHYVHMNDMWQAVFFVLKLYPEYAGVTGVGTSQSLSVSGRTSQ